MRLFLLAFAAASLFAQQPNTVTATVSLTRAVPAGTALFQVQLVEATLASTVDSALVPLTPAGITAAHLQGVNVALSQGFVLTTYEFRFPVPSAEFTATRDKLIAAQRSLANSQTQGLGWSSSQTPTDDDLAEALRNAMPALLEKARSRAELLAGSMNASLGPVVSLSTPALAAASGAATFTLTASYSVTPSEPAKSSTEP